MTVAVRFTLSVGQYHGNDGNRYMVRAVPSKMPWYCAVRLQPVMDVTDDSVLMGEGPSPMDALDDVVVKEHAREKADAAR